MTPSTYPTRLIRMLVLGAIVAGTVVSVADAVPVVEGTSAQANFSTPQGLKADGLRLQGIAQVYQRSQQAASAPTSQGLKADGLRLQGIAQVYQQNQPVRDVFERFAAVHPYGVGLAPATQSLLVQRPPDVRDAAQANVAVPDVLERYATTHPYGSGLTSSTESLLSRPPDVQDAAAGIELSPATTSTLVSRPPDISDAAQVARTVSFSQSSGFHWGDWAIGIGSGMGLILLLGAGLVLGRRQRHHVQTA
jgi:hypothetical protein